MNPNVEEWRSLESLGFPGYKVSSHGAVIGIRGYCLSSNPKPDGYVYVTLYNKGRGKTFPVHQLVAHKFIGSPEEGQTVDHIDRNTTNNHFLNLRWATKSEQALNRIPYIQNGKRKPVQQLNIDRELIRIWNSLTEAENEMGYPKSSLSWVIRKKKPYRGFLWEFVSNEIEGEIWREFTLPGSETHWASNLGRIRRPVPKGSSAHEITAGSTGGVYMSISILTEGSPKNIYVHVLVALAHYGPKPEGYVVNHKNGNKSDNRPDNLEYVTPSENSQHAYDIGLHEGKGNSIPIQQFSLKGKFIADHKSIAAAVIATKVSRYSITKSLNEQIHSQFIWEYIKR